MGHKTNMCLFQNTCQDHVIFAPKALKESQTFYVHYLFKTCQRTLIFVPFYIPQHPSGGFDELKKRHKSRIFKFHSPHYRFQNISNRTLLI